MNVGCSISSPPLPQSTAAPRDTSTDGLDSKSLVPDNNDNTGAKLDEASSTDTSEDQELTSDEMRELSELKQRDLEVKAHEQAHIAAGGSYVRSGAQFEYEKGPDGVNYAVEGEVQIDTSEIPGDPEATIRKMQVVRSAALAPANPSAQDQRVAAQATQTENKMRFELLTERYSETAAAETGSPDTKPGATPPETDPPSPKVSLGSLINIFS